MQSTSKVLPSQLPPYVPPLIPLRTGIINIIQCPFTPLCDILYIEYPIAVSPFLLPITKPRRHQTPKFSVYFSLYSG